MIKVSINKSIKLINQYLSNFYIFLLRFEVSQVRELEHQEFNSWRNNFLQLFLKTKKNFVLEISAKFKFWGDRV